MAPPEIRQPRVSAECLSLAGLLLVGAAVRAFAWSQTAVLFNDGPIFLAMAEAIGEGRWAEVVGHPFHPLYPALVALVAAGAGTSISLENAAVTVSIAGGLLSILGIFFFVRRAFGRDLAWLAAWTVTLHPWAVDFSSDVMSDGIYAGLYLVGFASMARLLEKPEPATGLVFGALGGLAYLARPEGVGLILIGGALLGARIWFEGEARSKALASIVTLVLAGAVVMSSLLIPLAQQTGEITLTRKKSLSGLVAGRADVKIDERAALPEPKKAAQKMAIPLPRSSQQADGGGAVPPPRTLLGFGEAISEAVRTSLAALRYEVALFAALGVGLFRKPLKIEREAAVFAPAILYTGVLILLFWGAGYVARRHALAALLPLCAYAAIGWRVACTGAVDRFLEGHEAMASRLKSPVGVCLLLVLALGIVWGPRDVRPRRLERTPMRSAAEWLGRHDPISQPVAAQKLRVAYYAGARFVPLPSGTNGAIERQLRALGAHWVVIDEAQLENHRGLAEGLDDWLVPVHTVKSDGHRVLVLKMRSEPAI